MNLSKRSFKILDKIQRGKYKYKASPKEQEEVKLLYDEKLIHFKPNNDKINYYKDFKILRDGEIALEKYKKETRIEFKSNLRWRLNFALSVAAIIISILAFIKDCN